MQAYKKQFWAGGLGGKSTHSWHGINELKQVGLEKSNISTNDSTEKN